MGEDCLSGDESYRAKFMEERCDSGLEKYKMLEKIGEGSYGLVSRGYHRETRKNVAIKQVLVLDKEMGIHFATVREIKSLDFLKHENIIKLVEVCKVTESLSNKLTTTHYLVFDFCEYDLGGLLDSDDVEFNLGEIKMILKQLLNGLHFIHKHKYLHGDIKPANILITKEGKIKIGDFGLARKITAKFCCKIVSLWYRPPEIILDVEKFGLGVDIWSVGCIMLEMLTTAPILKGSDTEQEHLNLIAKLCGPISPEVFATAKNLGMLNECNAPKKKKRRSRSRNKRRKLKKNPKECSVKSNLQASVKNEYALDLLDKLLTVNPVERICSSNALNHDFFRTDPLPCELSTKFQPLNPRYTQASPS